METTLKDLLEDFDKALPDTINYKTLMKKYSYTMINNALGSGILNYNVEKTQELSLGSFGLSLLIQIRTKQAIDKLDNSIKNFDESSSKQSENMAKSINNFSNKSSEQAEHMIKLTKALFGLTIALFLIGIGQVIFLLYQIFK